MFYKMRKVIVSIFALFFIVLGSCNKDDAPKPVPMSTSMIVGVWKYTANGKRETVKFDNIYNYTIYYPLENNRSNSGKWTLNENNLVVDFPDASVPDFTAVITQMEQNNLTMTISYSNGSNVIRNYVRAL
jgi:PKD repeat protein